MSMGPREKASQEVLAKRKEALAKGWSFSHWPWEANGTWGEVSATNEKYKAPSLTEDQWKLI